MADAERDIAEILRALADDDGYPRAAAIVQSWGDVPGPAHRELATVLADRLPADPVRGIGAQPPSPPFTGDRQEYALLSQTITDLARRPSDPAVLPILVDICHRLAARGLLHVLRSIGYHLARNHSLADVVDIFHREEPRAALESWTVLLHEYVARGHDLSDDPAVGRYLAAVRESGHPLAVLPARLVEGEPPALGAISTDYVEPPLPPLIANGLRPAGLERRFEGAVVVTHPPQRRALLAPYEYWIAIEMNARVDAEVVRFDEPIDVVHVDVESLHRLSIASMSGLTPPILRRVSVSKACIQLQSKAAHGGTYGGPLGEAYGRLAKWRCVAALADVDLRFDQIRQRADLVETIMRQAQRCAWWMFWETRWFYDSELDLGGGLAVLRDGGRTLAVVAATETP